MQMSDRDRGSRNCGSSDRGSIERDLHLFNDVGCSTASSTARSSAAGCGLPPAGSTAAGQASFTAAGALNASLLDGSRQPAIPPQSNASKCQTW